MLVVARKEDEQIVLTLPDGREVKLIVTEIRGNRVRFGIEAPKDVNIYRPDGKTLTTERR